MNPKPDVRAGQGALAARSGAEKVAALVRPRSVALVGASDRPGSWSRRVWNNLIRYQFEGGLYPVNPKQDEIWGVRCYRALADLPEPPDLVLVLVPAPGVAGLLAEAAEAGARSAIIYTSGFAEDHSPEGAARAAELARVIAETGLGVVGPNCLGCVFGPAGLVSMTDERRLDLAPGPVALVGQSGGVMLFANRVLAERGIQAGYIVTSGNEAGLDTADYISYFAEDPGIRVIVSYLEAVHDPERFLAACRRARDAGKYVVTLKLGASESGRAAAMAHTGALAGKMEVFDAVAGAAGVIRAETLDDLVELVDYLTHAAPPRGRRLGAVTLSGAFRGLLLDAAGANGLSFPPLAAETRAQLDALLGAGSIVGNPLDGGFGVLSSQETFLQAIRIMQADPGIDLLLLQEEAPRDPDLKRSATYLRALSAHLAAEGGTPVAMVSMVTHSQNDFSRAIRAELPNLAFLQEANKGLRTLATLSRRQEMLALAAAPAAQATPAAAQPEAARAARAAAQAAGGAPVTLDEARSKALFAAYGIAAPEEALCPDLDRALAAAGRIGYPVVLKGVSAAIAHKTEAGIVQLGLRGPEELRAAHARILANARAYAPDAVLEGVLVCRQVEGALEVSLGAYRDPEFGLVAMTGSGGVLIETFNDAAFAALPITPAVAGAMIDRTRMARRLPGLRGGPPYDRAALVAALVALGRLIADLSDVLEEIDINPLALLPRQGGALALDGLVVLRDRAAAAAGSAARAPQPETRQKDSVS